jgi:hypothetical protein
MGGFMVMVDGVPCFPAVPGWSSMEISDFHFPDITEEEIEDKSKNDALAKTIVLLQLGTFGARVVARIINKLPITELEVATSAYVVITTITYIVWWKKPYNAERYVPATLRPHARGKNFALRYMKGRRDLRATLMNVVTGQFSAANITKMNRVPTMFVGKTQDTTPDNLTFKLQCIFGIVFGGMHVACWNFPFPTVYEQWAWRASAIAITWVPLTAPGTVIIIPVLPYAESWWGKTLGHIVYWSYAILTPAIYVLARLVLIGLSFYTLRALPNDAFEEVKWTAYLPTGIQ